MSSKDVENLGGGECETESIILDEKKEADEKAMGLIICITFLSLQVIITPKRIATTLNSYMLLNKVLSSGEYVLEYMDTFVIN